MGEGKWLINTAGEGGAILERFPWLYSLDTRLSVFNCAVIRPDAGIAFINDTFNACLADCPTLDGEAGRERTLRQVCYLNIVYFMHSLLERKDRMSMASALEVRVPFAHVRTHKQGACLYCDNLGHALSARSGPTAGGWRFTMPRR